MKTILIQENSLGIAWLWCRGYCRGKKETHFIFIATMQGKITHVFCHYEDGGQIMPKRELFDYATESIAAALS